MTKEVTELSNLNIRYFKTAEDVLASTEVGENDICFTEELDSVDWGDITGSIENQTDLINKLDTKVDKVDGKTLTTNDFTDIYKSRLDSTVLTPHHYSADEGLQYNWYKVFEVVDAANIILILDIDLKADSNYTGASSFRVIISTYSTSSWSVMVQNRGVSIGGGLIPDLRVAIDATGNVYICATCSWSNAFVVSQRYYSRNAVVSSYTVPFTNVGYASEGEVAGFTSIGLIKNSGTIRVNQETGAADVGANSGFVGNLYGIADKATQDANGNVINTTYATKTELEAKQDALNIAEISGDNW